MKKFLKQLKDLSRSSNAQAGFTLVELLVSLTLFTIVVTAAVGSLYTVNQASARVTAMRTVLDNLNFAMESMSRTIRTGSNIVCGGAGALGGPSCPFGGSSSSGGSAISLQSTLGTAQTIQYQWVIDNTTQNGEIQKCAIVNGGLINCVAITAPEINIQKMYFFVDGADPADNKQPSVMMIIQGVANAGTQNIAPFAIQTLLSQRAGE
ncbi:MAG: hypothetical protein JWM92_342 [Candidatus Nomurabacteria bacterium]|jgi:prepilin-type N-terminal cleavage/methylation domain-containing protein|nr:hypothetical protein [Candidatus Nomurabacteria bacterium]